MFRLIAEAVGSSAGPAAVSASAASSVARTAKITASAGMASLGGNFRGRCYQRAYAGFAAPRPTPYFQVDAFTETPFKGNSAAVVVTPAEIGWDDEALLLIAREHNLAETVYVTPLPARSADGGAAFAIRWFTPTAEEVLCGHATLAAAHVLFEHGYAPSGRPISFESKHAGTLTAERVEADSGVEIGLNFPALGLEAVEADERLPGALSGATVVSTMRTDIDDIVVEVADAETVRRMVPNIDALRDLQGSVYAGSRAFVVTAAGDGKHDHASRPEEATDYVARVFDPGCAIIEDPVTGSAHCALAPFSILGGGRVRLQGPAVTVFAGMMFV